MPDSARARASPAARGRLATWSSSRPGRDARLLPRPGRPAGRGQVGRLLADRRRRARSSARWTSSRWRRSTCRRSEWTRCGVSRGWSPADCSGDHSIRSARRRLRQKHRPDWSQHSSEPLRLADKPKQPRKIAKAVTEVLEKIGTVHTEDEAARVAVDTVREALRLGLRLVLETRSQGERTQVRAGERFGQRRVPPSDRRCPLPRGRGPLRPSLEGAGPGLRARPGPAARLLPRPGGAASGSQVGGLPADRGRGQSHRARWTSSPWKRSTCRRSGWTHCGPPPGWFRSGSYASRQR